jgi:hypothetical protein
VAAVASTQGRIRVPGFQCSTCGRLHDHLPRDIAFRRPDPFFDVPEDERPRRILIDDDVCIIDNTRFFVRGVLYLPLSDGSGRFGWGAWARVSELDYQTYIEAWTNDTEDSVPPFPGHLASKLDPYPGSSGLPVTVKLQSGGQRPVFTVASDEHPLGIDQRTGISEAKAHSFVERWA